MLARPNRVSVDARSSSGRRRPNRRREPDLAPTRMTSSCRRGRRAAARRGACDMALRGSLALGQSGSSRWSASKRRRGVLDGSLRTPRSETTRPPQPRSAIRSRSDVFLLVANRALIRWLLDSAESLTFPPINGHRDGIVPSWGLIGQEGASSSRSRAGDMNGSLALGSVRLGKMRGIGGKISPRPRDRMTGRNYTLLFDKRIGATFRKRRFYSLCDDEDDGQWTADVPRQPAINRRHMKGVVAIAAAKPRSPGAFCASRWPEDHSRPRPHRAHRSAPSPSSPGTVPLRPARLARRREAEQASFAT